MNEKLSFIIEFKNMASKGLKDVKKNVEDVKKSTDGLKKETKGLRGAFDKMSGGAKKAFGKVKDSASNSFNAIKKGAGALGPMIAGAFAAVGVASFGKDVLQVGMEFDSMMSEVQALSGATGDDLDKLRQKAKDLGSSTKFSASESAEAFKFMSKRNVMDTHAEMCA